MQKTRFLAPDWKRVGLLLGFFIFVCLLCLRLNWFLDPIPTHRRLPAMPLLGPSVFLMLALLAALGAFIVCSFLTLWQIFKKQAHLLWLAGYLTLSASFYFVESLIPWKENGLDVFEREFREDFEPEELYRFAAIARSLREPADGRRKTPNERNRDWQRIDNSIPGFKEKFAIQPRIRVADDYVTIFWAKDFDSAMGIVISDEGKTSPPHADNELYVYREMHPQVWIYIDLF